jgi:hypothetical protein
VNERPALGLIVVAGFIGTIGDVSSPVFGLAAESFLTVERANTSNDDDDEEFTAELMVEGLLIPTNGTEGAFGYGFLTGDGGEGGGEDTILVTHTHPGVLDSEDQGFVDDPIWHNHFIRLGHVEQCEEGQGVVDITWQSPGEVEINDNTARVSDIPTDEFEGWDSITGEPLSLTLGESVSEVVSFKLDPVFGGEGDGEEEEEGLEAVCLTHIRSAEEEVNSE